MKKRRLDRKRLFQKNRRGQIWVETVIYTLIAFALIGLVLAYARPRLDEIRDNAIIEQSITLLEDLNQIIGELEQSGAGNQRVVEVAIRKGELTFDGVDDRLLFEIDTPYEYSQAGENVNVGNVLVFTRKVSDMYDVNMTINYTNQDIKFDDADDIRVLGQASTPYKVLISNQGQSGSQTIINVEVIS